jgi:hypothetical protein
MEVNLRRYDGCHIPVLSTGNFLQKRDMNKIDYKKMV